jgi:hypothetical protein
VVGELSQACWQRGGQRIPYGLAYDGGKFRADGRMELASGELGLTCATFVLAVLAGAGLTLLDLATWDQRDDKRRADDDAWHASIVAFLKKTKTDDDITDEHIAGVESEKNCARYRPEEVAGACGLGPAVEKVSFQHVQPPARLIADSLLPRVADGPAPANSR